MNYPRKPWEQAEQTYFTQTPDRFPESDYIQGSPSRYYAPYNFSVRTGSFYGEGEFGSEGTSLPRTVTSLYHLIKKILSFVQSLDFSLSAIVSSVTSILLATERIQSINSHILAKFGTLINRFLAHLSALISKDHLDGKRQSSLVSSRIRKLLLLLTVILSFILLPKIKSYCLEKAKYEAVVLYEIKPNANRSLLPAKPGDSILILNNPLEKNWLWAVNRCTGNQGYIPKNYIKIGERSH